MTKIINCTPHVILISLNGEVTTFAPSGIIPRVGVVEAEAMPLGGFPCVKTSMGEVSGLPEKEEGIFFIVSGMVFGASDRFDLIAPDTGKTCIRNEKGHIVSVTRFISK